MENHLRYQNETEDPNRPRETTPRSPISGPRKRKGIIREYAEALLTAFLIAFVLRSFVVEAFKIPSCSMIPTLVVGDHLFVNKFIYGLRVPFTKKWMARFSDPERGDPIVFIYPVDEGKDFIKRVIGLPGDKIRLEGDHVFINDQPVQEMPISLEPPAVSNKATIPVTQTPAATAYGVRSIPNFPGWSGFSYFLENLGPRIHLVQFDDYPNHRHADYTVPEGHYFVMGDNRDNSADSREWGFVPMENIKGKAMFIWLSIDWENKRLRWERFGKWIQ